MKILTGVITYNPEIIRLEQNIKAIYSQVDRIILVDNGSKNIEEIKSLANKKEILLIENQVNLGVAKALNKIGEYAYSNGFDYFLTLDQDSICEKNMVETLTANFKKNEKLAIVAPLVRRQGIEHFPTKTDGIVKTAITSGNIVDVKAWKKIGGYWDYLFIDEVDHEFCYRLRSYGYEIMIDERAEIKHELGKQSAVKILFHIFHPLNHSAFRRYYITRNCLIVGYLYPKELEPYPKRKKMLLKMAISILCCEKEKIRKLNSMIKGWLNAKKWIREFENRNTFEYRS